MDELKLDLDGVAAGNALTATAYSSSSGSSGVAWSEASAVSLAGTPPVCVAPLAAQRSFEARAAATNDGCIGDPVAQRVPPCSATRRWRDAYAGVARSGLRAAPTPRTNAPRDPSRDGTVLPAQDDASAVSRDAASSGGHGSSGAPSASGEAPSSPQLPCAVPEVADERVAIDARAAWRRGAGHARDQAGATAEHSAAQYERKRERSPRAARPTRQDAARIAAARAAALCARGSLRSAAEAEALVRPVALRWQADTCLCGEGRVQARECRARWNIS